MPASYCLPDGGLRKRKAITVGPGNQEWVENGRESLSDHLRSRITLFPRSAGRTEPARIVSFPLIGLMLLFLFGGVTCPLYSST